MSAQAQPPQRRCVASGQSLPVERLIRFVIGPDDQLVADLSENLPGRGLWLCADQASLHKALAQKAFHRAARCKVVISDGFEAMLAQQLLRASLQMLGFARKAGAAVCGQAKVEALARAGKIGVLITASDASPDGAARLERLVRALAPQAGHVTCLSSVELGLAFGREHVIHAALAPGRLAGRVLRETNRLAGFRSQPAAPEPVPVRLDQPDRTR